MDTMSVKRRQRGGVIECGDDNIHQAARWLADLIGPAIQRGRGLDLQKWLAKMGREFHWPGYQFLGPGTHLKKRLKHGDPSIN